MDNSYVGAATSPTLCLVHWDRLFEDLEGQLASEWEAERAALDAESERLRISKLDLSSRVKLLQLHSGPLHLHLADQRRCTVRLRAVGADWIGVQPAEAQGVLLVPLRAIMGLEVDHGMLLGSLEEAVPAQPSLRERMTLGFVLRDLARRRLPLRLGLSDGTTVHGTADRAAADHLDLAVHDPGEPRRATAVRAFRIIPFDALVWISAEDAAL